MRRWTCLLTVLMMLGCIESNPQPMPGKHDIGHTTDTTEAPGDDAIAVADVLSETVDPADASSADLPFEEVLDTISPEDMADGEVQDIVAPPGVGPARGGILVASERYIYSELDEHTTSRIHGTVFATPLDPFVGVFDQGDPFLSVTAQEGPCVLMTPEPAECPDYCQDGTICKGKECVAWAKPVTVGEVSISGLKTGPVVLHQSDYDGMVYSNPLDYDLFDETSTVTISTTGGDIPAFSASVPGFLPLDTGWTNGLVLTLLDNAENTVTWNAGGPDDFVRLVIKSSNSCHGCPLHAQLVCDAPDQGSLTLPAALVEALPTIYGAEICVAQDCPMSYLERRRCATIELPGAPATFCLASRTYFLAKHGVE
jgi:hypothetical protein